MKLLTWNVNGIRSLPEPLDKILSQLDADICCFQETKITRDMMTSDLAQVQNYQACFSFCKVRSGYSGVATFFKNNFAPVAAEEGLTSILAKSQNNSTPIGRYSQKCNGLFTNDQLKSLDSEGRALITEHVIKTSDDADWLKLFVINVYCPRADPDKPDRKTFKLDFYQLLKLRVEEILISDTDKNRVIIAGDMNCSRQRIDHCEPDDDPDFEDNESRKIFNDFIYDSKNNENGLMVDVFRQLHPTQTDAFTCWCTKLSARQTNYGTRIDYILMDRRLFEENTVVSVKHLVDVHGSDHCPVLVELNVVSCLPASRLPDLCTKHMPEFRGVQQKLTGFLVKCAKITEIEKTTSCAADSGNVKRRKLAKVITLEDCFSVSVVSKNKLTTNEDSSCEKSDALMSSQSSTQNSSNSNGKEEWKKVFGNSSAKVPICSGHNESCILRTVKKQGPNLNKQFYCCARGLGRKGDKNAQCGFFKWL